MINTLNLMRILRRPKNYFLGYTRKTNGKTDKTLSEIIQKLKDIKPQGYFFGEKNDGLVSYLGTSENPEEFSKIREGYFRRGRLNFEVYKNSQGKRLYYVDGSYSKGKDTLDIKKEQNIKNKNI